MDSKFERLTNDQLLKYFRYAKGILKSNIPTINNTLDLSDFYNNIMDSDQSSKLGAPLGRELTRFDIEYMYYIIKNNDIDVKIIKRPELTTIYPDFVSSETVRIHYTRSGEVETYVPDDVDSSYLHLLQDIDEIDPWYWDQTDTDERGDSDISDTWFNV